MTRKLATIQKIVSIEPIPDADAIEKATVLGWEVVVAKKDELEVGDLVVYIEIDSIMPDKPEYEFLRKRKFRVRTIKLRKTVSQGLILPLSVLPKGKYTEGKDVTNILGVVKYDPQAVIEQRLLEEKNAREKNKIKKFLNRMKWYRRLFGKRRASFPSFIKKTDEDRIQLFPNICQREKDTVFEISEKLDGQSGTYFLVKHKGLFRTRFTFGVCSRNLLLPKPDNSSYWEIAKKYNIEKVLRKMIGDSKYIVLQGEIIGPGIQENKYKFDERDFFAFNLIFSNKEKYCNLEAKMMLEDCGIKFVPLLNNNFAILQTISEMVEYAKGKSVIANVLREGVVVRNYEKNISFKVINPDFLLKHSE